METIDSEILCSCNHLTNFAVLMEVKDNTVSFVTNFSKSYACKKSNLNRISRFSNAYDYYEITPSGNVQSEQPDLVKKIINLLVGNVAKLLVRTFNCARLSCLIK